MKKIFILNLLLILLLTSACQNKTEVTKEIIEEEPIIEEEKQKYNENPIKLALYDYNNINYIKTEEYSKEYAPITEIGVFSILYTDEDVVPGYSYKNLWYEYYNTYENIDDFKIGYEISFDLEDNTHIEETILKPKNVFNYSFSPYLYIWLYDDINQTASWYSHLEEDEYNENTIMSSIKLMQVTDSILITTPIKLTVFTYKDELDFNKEGKYIGESKFTLNINIIK